MALPKAYEFVKEFKEATEHFVMPWDSSNYARKSLSSSLVKVNFEAGKLRSGGKGWGVVDHDSVGCIIFVKS